LFSLLSTQAQTRSVVDWTKIPFEHKVFIENKGQFNGRNGLLGSKIMYGNENSGVQIYFTTTGLSYRIDDY